jgi:CRP/FNR family cyclic AMP-dependent transcriptional regulator
MKSIKTIADIINEHSFFEGLSQEQIQFIAGCGKNVMFHEGQVIAEPGDPADLFYLIREGQIALSIAVPPRKAFLFQTLGPRDLVGLSWLISPYLWTVKVQAVSSTRAIAIDGACIRKKCEYDPSLGYKLLQHIVKILVLREDACRLHLLDVYGDHK